MLNILSVGLGGCIGAVCRYLIGLLPMNETTSFPIKTFGINVIGCILIGVITVVAAKNSSLNPHVLLFLKVGLCGGFTTFSTFALETVDLMKNGNVMMAFLYVLGSVLVGVGVIFAVEYFTMK
ncbi:MAG: fluoride efflux transporter CrcB [Lachnospiraceae bacterium]|nr:fluoride efflux transporter CrcB [Lachnospiraceae bacterium]